MPPLVEPTSLAEDVTRPILRNRLATASEESQPRLRRRTTTSDNSSTTSIATANNSNNNNNNNNNNINNDNTNTFPSSENVNDEGVNSSTSLSPRHTLRRATTLDTSFNNSNNAKNNNNNNNLRPESQTTNVIVHTVAPSDTLAGVALKYGIKVSALRKYNRLWPHDSIHLRKKIYIPLAHCSPASTPPLSVNTSRNASLDLDSLPDASISGSNEEPFTSSPQSHSIPIPSTNASNNSIINSVKPSTTVMTTAATTTNSATNPTTTSSETSPSLTAATTATTTTTGSTSENETITSPPLPIEKLPTSELSFFPHASGMHNGEPTSPSKIGTFPRPSLISAYDSNDPSGLYTPTPAPAPDNTSNTITSSSSIANTTTATNTISSTSTDTSSLTSFNLPSWSSVTSAIRTAAAQSVKTVDDLELDAATSWIPGYRRSSKDTKDASSSSSKLKQQHKSNPKIDHHNR